MLDVIKRHLVSAAASLRPPENNDGWLPGDIGSLLSAPLAGLVLPCFRPGHTKKTHFSDTFFRRHRREVFFPFLIRIYIFSYFQSDDNNWKNELLELTAKKASSRFFFFAGSGLITPTFRPSAKSAPNPAERARAPAALLQIRGQTSSGPTGERGCFPVGYFKLKHGDYILSESAA